MGPVARPRWFLAAYGLAAAACLVVYLLATSDVVRACIVVGESAGAVAAIAVGVLVFRPRSPRPWLVLAAGQAVFGVAWAFWEAHILTEGAPPNPDAVISFFFQPGYPLWVVALVILLYRREPDAVSAVDVGVLATALFVPALSLLFYDYAVDDTLTVAWRADQIAFGVFDIVILAATLRLLVSAGRRSLSFGLVLGAASAWLFSDVIWNWSTRLGSYSPGNWADAGWLASPMLLGIASLSPRMATVFEPQPVGRRRLKVNQLSLLIVAALVAPATLIVQSLRGALERGEAIAIAVSAGVLSLLILLRIGLLLREQGRLADALGAQNAKLRELASVIESSHDAILATDRLGRITSWNRGAQQLFGWGANEVVGREFDFLVPEDVRMEQREKRAHVLETGASLDFETEWLHTTRKRVPVEVALSPIYSADDTVSGVAAIIRDISARQELEAERDRVLAAEKRARSESDLARQVLQKQNERLHELDRLKDDFVASVSHELRTPLTSIRGYLELVLDGEAGELTSGQRSFLEVVLRNGDRLLRLVSDLLFVAQVDAGKIMLEPTRCELDEIAAEAIEAARPAAAGKNIEFQFEAGSAITLEADRARIAQVLDNLLSNAVKFTPAGGRISVRTFPDGDDAVIEVTDDGIGIAPDDQKRLFERFFRAEAATDSAIQGTGLGLAIVKAIVDAHGGSIAVDSAPVRGTTFRVHLPFTRDRVAA